MAAISGSIPPEPPPPDSSSTELCFLFLSFLFSLRYAFCFSSCCRKTISLRTFKYFNEHFKKIYNFYPTIYEHSWTTNGLVFVWAKPMSYSLDLPMWLHWLIKNNLCSQLPSVWGGGTEVLFSQACCYHTQIHQTRQIANCILFSLSLWISHRHTHRYIN